MPDASGSDSWEDEEEEADPPGLVQWIDTRIELGRDALPIPAGTDRNPISVQVGEAESGAFGPVLAGCGRRAMAKLVDGMLVGGLFMAGAIAWLRRFSGEELVAWIVVVLLFGVLGGWGFWVLYHVLLAGDTVGKRLLGLQVTDELGRPIGPGRALGRALAETVSAGILGIGYLFAVLDPRKRSLHDHLCGTRVVLRRTLPGRR